MALEIKETLRESPGTRHILVAYILPSMGLFTLASFISPIFEKGRPYQIFTIVFLIAYLFFMVFVLLPRRKTEYKPVPVDFKPDGEHFYGYSRQSEEFRQVVEQAVHDKDVNGLLPIISIIGVSGVGKSSFLLNYFSEREHTSPTRLLRIDLREGLAGIQKTLSVFFSERPSESILGADSLRKWLGDVIDNTEEVARLKDSVLIIDQFEQILLNKPNVHYVKAFVESLTKHCCLTIFSSRSDVLGDTIYDARQKELFSALEIYQKIRLFVLTPICHGSEDEINVYRGLFQCVFDAAPEDPSLFEEVTSMSWHSFGDRSALPIYIKLIMYALKQKDIVTAGRLQSFNKGKNVSIDWILTPFVDELLQTTGNQSTSLRILFAMSRDGGISEGYEPEVLENICGVQQGTDGFSRQLGRLEECGTIIPLPGNKYSIVHEHLGEIIGKYSRRILSLPERNQINTRLDLLERCANNTKSFSRTKFLDSQSYLSLSSIESYVALCCILLSCFRLFFWPFNGHPLFYVDMQFLPSALLICAGVFFSTCLFGNIGKPLSPHQNWTYYVPWCIVLAMPVLALGILFVWPAKWLLAAAGVTLVTSVNHYLTGHWAVTQGSEDVGHLFRRYAFTGLTLFASLLLLQVLLYQADRSCSKSISALAFVTAIILSCGFLRFAVTWWNGRNQRNILAQIDSDIVVQRLLEKVKPTKNQS